MKRQNLMVCVVGLMFLTVGFSPSFSLADDGYDVDWIEEIIQKASNHDDLFYSDDQTSDSSIWTSGWLEDLNEGGKLGKWLKTEVTPGVLMQDIIVPLCVLYATADQLISDSNEVAFSDWIKNYKLQKAWIWVLKNKDAYQSYGDFSEVMKSMQALKEGKETLADVLDKAKKIKDFAATGDVFEIVSPKDYLIGRLTELSEGTFEGEMIEGVSNLISLYSVITAPTPLGMAIFILNFANYCDNVKSLEDYLSGLTNLRHAYLLYYIGDELFEEEWHDSFYGHEEWDIIPGPNNQEVIKMSLVDMMMFIPSINNDLPPLTGGWWFEKFPYNLGYPYFGGYYYHPGYDGDTMQTLSALKGFVMRYDLLERYNESESCNSTEKCFYNEWSKIFYEGDDSEKKLNDTKVFLGNLGSIFQYYKSIKPGSSYASHKLLDALKAVKAEFNGLDELRNGPQLNVLGEWDNYLKDMREHFATQISIALRADSGRSSYCVGRGIGFHFMGDLFKGAAQTASVLKRAKLGYDRALSAIDTSHVYPDTNYNEGLAYRINGNWWFQRFRGPTYEDRFALYIPLKGSERVRVVYGNFLKYYEGDGDVPPLRPKLGMPTTDRTSGIQLFENGYMKEFEGDTPRVYIKPKEPVSITNISGSSNGSVSFNDMSQESLEVKYNGRCDVNVDAQDGYLIDKVIVKNAGNDTLIKEMTVYAQSHSFRLNDIRSNYTIDATFIEDEQYGKPLRITSPLRGQVYPFKSYINLRWNIADDTAGISERDELYFTLKKDSSDTATYNNVHIRKDLDNYNGFGSLDIPIPMQFPEGDDFRIYLLDENGNTLGISYPFKIRQKAPFFWNIQRRISYASELILKPNIKISLYQKNGSELRSDDDYKFVKTLVRSVENEGEAKIEIPSGYTGDGYRILVEGGAGEKVWDEGDDFSIAGYSDGTQDAHITPIIRSVTGSWSAPANWNDPATWGGTVPGPNDIVEIASGTVINVDSTSPIEIADLVNNGVLSNGKGLHPMIIVNGDVTNNYRIRTQSFDSAGGLSIRIYGNIFANGHEWDPTHTELAGNGSKTVTGKLEGENLTIAGNFELSGEAVFDTKVFFSKRAEAALTINSSVTFKELATDATINGMGTLEVTRKISGDIQGNIATIIPPVTHHITVTANTGGVVNVSEEDVPNGEGTKIDVEADGGYEIEKLEVVSQGDMPELECGCYYENGSMGCRNTCCTYGYGESGDWGYTDNYTLEDGVFTFSNSAKSMVSISMENVTAACEVVVTFKYVAGGTGLGTITLNPTIRSVRDGIWTHRRTWSENRVPDENDVVEIDHNVKLEYSSRIAGLQVNSGASLATFYIYGTPCFLMRSLIIEGDVINNGTIERSIPGIACFNRFYITTYGSIDTTNGIWKPYQTYFKGENSRSINGIINSYDNYFYGSFTLSGDPVFKGDNHLWKKLAINGNPEFENISGAKFNGDGTVRITGDCSYGIDGNISKVIFDGENIHFGSTFGESYNIIIEPDVEITSGTVIQNFEEENDIIDFGDNDNDTILVFNGNVTNYGTITNNSPGCLFTRFNGEFENHGTVEACAKGDYFISAADEWHTRGGISVLEDGETLPLEMWFALPVEEGGSKTFVFTPADGWIVNYIKIDGQRIDTRERSYTFNDVTEDHTLYVRFAETHRITVEESEHGSVSPSGDVEVIDGEDQTFYFNPDLGYKVSTIWVDGEPIENYSYYSYKLWRVREDHTLRVEFEPVYHTLTASSGTGGSISPSGDTEVQQGYDRAFSITPDTGYQIAELLVDGEPVEPETNYTFQSITGNHSISATFERITLHITASARANGVISPTGEAAVLYGDSQSFEITPSPGYRVAELLVDGEPAEPSETGYTFPAVTENHTISATFELTDYTITATFGQGGTISPAGDVGVTHGSDQAFTITPDDGYEILEILADSEPVAAETGYTFINVTKNHTIAASFRLREYTITASAGNGGAISPQGDVTVSHGSGQTFEITPETGYQIAELLVDGEPVQAETTYPFLNVTGNHTISASFEQIGYTITATPGSGGTISPAGNVGIFHGSNQAYAITPAAGYQIADVQVDGVSVGAVAAYTFQNVTADRTISAAFELLDYTITASAGSGGSISPAGSVSVPHGSTKNFSIIPASGYQVSDVRVDGASVGAVTGYAFTNVTGDRSISASFERLEYTISASAGTGGTISPSGNVTVFHGDNQAFTFAPNAGYQVSDVVADGVSKGAVTNHTFPNVSGDHTISVSFEPITYTITASASANGSISPSGTVTVPHGNNSEFVITPAPGYQVADVLVDGSSVGAVTSYTFPNVTGNRSIAASFEVGQYTVTATAGANGSIDPPGESSVSHGNDASFTITPDTGYVVESVSVDNASVGSVGEYTFTNVIGNHTIHAAFIEEDASHTVTVEAPAGCTVLPGNTVEVPHGGSQSFTFTAGAGERISEIGYSDTNAFPYAENEVAYHYMYTPMSVNLVTIEPLSSVTVTIDEIHREGTMSVYTEPEATHTIAWIITGDGLVTVDGSVYEGSDFKVLNAGETLEISFGEVDNVLLDGVSIGQSTGYTFDDDSYHVIEVIFPEPYAITATSGDNGHIDPSSASVTHGSSQTFTITPVSCGYLIDDVLIDGVSVGAVSEYTFTNVTEPHEIEAIFRQNPGPFTITIKINGNGIVMDNSGNTYADGDTLPAEGYIIVFSSVPDTDWQFAYVDDGGAGALISPLFQEWPCLVWASCDLTLTFNFRQNNGTFDVYFMEPEGGSISPLGTPIGSYYDRTITIDSGSNQTFTFIPDAGMKVASASIFSRSTDESFFVSAPSSYTFTNVQDDWGLNVDFSPDDGTNDIHTWTDGDGTISPSPDDYGPVTVNDGESQTFTFTPDADFHISEVVVDYVPLGAVSDYTFENVVGGHELRVSFEPN